MHQILSCTLTECQSQVMTYMTLTSKLTGETLQEKPC